MTDSKSRLKHLFDTKVLADCTLLVGKEKQPVTGHKIILSAASSVLHQKLETDGADQPKVTLPDVEPEIFQSMLKYIYLDSLDGTGNTVFGLAAAAKAYQMPHLLKKCCEYISQNLTVKNVLQAYSFANDSNDAEDLKKKCETMMRTETKAVLADSSFEEACLDVVVALFSQEVLEIDSELDLLEAADRYAKHISKCDYANKDLSIRSILEKIRFLSLTPEEFEKGRASTTILASSEACAILANIASDKTTVPFPEGFSLRRDPRTTSNVSIIKLMPEVKFQFKVDDFENLANKMGKAWSSKCKLQNLKWKIGIEFLVEDSVKYLGIYAYSIWESETEKKSLKPEIEFTLVSTQNEKPMFSKKFTQTYSSESPNWGYKKFIEVSKLLDPTEHYIVDGGITFQVYIKVDE
ncbi:BTB/POZ domain-containing protein 3-like [Ostrinia nubilalis]|uniref:BTB/POZ domain-containing protein 3-like n=1 Tax=Ostrinia nubilalis TaxID=29057 RepID=UPI0030823763